MVDIYHITHILAFYATNSFISLFSVLKGLGNSLAEWHPCYIVLSGLYLYVLESEVSHNYQKCFR